MKPIRPSPGDTSWFIQDRFGLFIHWGLYAMAARHEWVRHFEEIPNEEYERKYFSRFCPDLYDPEAWADAAASAGMKYFVVTTKHHEGFCLWDSKLTDYKAPNTPAGRDLLRPMVDAFRARGIKVGFYHSLLDWHHPHYVHDSIHGPYRNHPDRAKINQGRDMALYAEYLRGQVRELLTDFGLVDMMFFDFSYPGRGPDGKGRADWQSEKLYRMVRDLAPQVVMADRLDLEDGWDYRSPEQSVPREWVTVNGQPVIWEACHTFSNSWGYHRDEEGWKSTDQLVRMLIDCVSKGGNLLLNVGPTARGEFDSRAMDRLADIGKWMRHHSRSIYGCTQALPEWPAPPDCRYTYNPQTHRLYLHVFAWPINALFLDGLKDRVEYAQLLNDGSEIRMGWPAHGDAPSGDRVDRQTVPLQLPTKKPGVVVPVIELFLKP